jgi:hypothetical protein
MIKTGSGVRIPGFGEKTGKECSWGLVVGDWGKDKKTVAGNQQPVVRGKRKEVAGDDKWGKD